MSAYSVKKEREMILGLAKLYKKPNITSSELSIIPEKRSFIFRNFRN